MTWKIELRLWLSFPFREGNIGLISVGSIFEVSLKECVLEFLGFYSVGRAWDLWTWNVNRWEHGSSSSPVFSASSVEEEPNSDSLIPL